MARLRGNKANDLLRTDLRDASDTPAIARAGEPPAPSTHQRAHLFAPDPYDIGYGAWNSGASILDNPYDFDSEIDEFEQWEAGWEDAADDNEQFGVGA